MAEPVIRELVSDADPALPGYFELFIESFHAWGREPVPELIAQIRRRGAGEPERIRNWVAEIEGDVAGMVRGGLMPTAGAGIVIHIAVNPKHRGARLGERLIRHAHEAYARESRTQGVPFVGTLFEVERARDAENDAHREENLARLRFFERIGCTLVSASYTQAALTDWLSPMPLNLLLLPGDAPMERERLIRDFHRDFWGFEADHPYVVRTIYDPDG